MCRFFSDRLFQTIVEKTYIFRKIIFGTLLGKTVVMSHILMEEIRINKWCCFSNIEMQHIILNVPSRHFGSSEAGGIEGTQIVLL